MKLKAYILLKDNSIICKSITNPSSKFEVTYKVDNYDVVMEYNFDRGKKYSKKKFLGYEQISFYEHGSKDPLDAKFNTKETTIKEMMSILKTGLFDKLIDSTKNQSRDMSIKVVLGLAGITGIVLIVLLG